MDICRKYVELHNKIKNIKIAMLTLHNESGKLRSMPMLTIKTECEGNIWFFTNLDSDKVNQLRTNPEVNLSYSDQSSEVYVSVSGRAEIVEDKKLVKEFWKPDLEEWLSAGPESNDIALMKVEMVQAEYWNGNNMVQIWDTTDVVKTSNGIHDVFI
jgi:general stress protein 26